MLDYIYFDCGACGEIGLESQLKEHPTRPIATDIGFCPKCSYEIDELLPLATVRATIESYGENPDQVMAEIHARAEE